VSWTLIRRTPAFRHRSSKLRLKFREGSIGVPCLVVKTRPVAVQSAPAVSLLVCCCFALSRSAVTQIPGRGSVASEASVLVSRCPRQPEDLPLTQSQDEDQDIRGVHRVTAATGRLQEAPRLVYRPRLALALPGLGARPRS
jgi:hypothetical protein